MRGANAAIRLGPHRGLGGGWSPMALGSALLAWWTADDATSLTLVGNQVSSWKDQVGGYTIVQGVSSARPIFNPTGFGGAPCLVFDGIDDELTSIGAVLGALPTGEAPGRLMAVCESTVPATDTTVRYIMSYGNGSTASARRLRRIVGSGTQRGGFHVGDGATPVLNYNSTMELTGRCVLEGIASGTNIRTAVNGKVSASVSVVPASVANLLRFGASESATAVGWWQGPARDIILTGPLTTLQSAALTEWALARRKL